MSASTMPKDSLIAQCISKIAHDLLLRRSVVHPVVFFIDYLRIQLGTGFEAVYFHELAYVLEGS